MLASLLRGHRHERRAARWLRRRGLKILARNLRLGPDEIDLLAREGDVAVIVEVRQRTAGHAAADLSISAGKIHRLRRAAGRLRRDHRLDRAVAIRIDLVTIDGAGCIVHVRGALDR
ncbi:MAG: YraN family protein [Planctomycetes bacterium]|nr:YraN family protein [Planctomycetota bacterium]